LDRSKLKDTNPLQASTWKKNKTWPRGGKGGETLSQTQLETTEPARERITEKSRASTVVEGCTKWGKRSGGRIVGEKKSGTLEPLIRTMLRITSTGEGKRGEKSKDFGTTAKESEN